MKNIKIKYLGLITLTFMLIIRNLRAENSQIKSVELLVCKDGNYIVAVGNVCTSGSGACIENLCPPCKPMQ